MTPVTARPWAVGDLAHYIRERLEADPILGEIWVQGQVSNVFRARSGHVYFTLRDDEGQLKSAFFKAQAQRSAYTPVDGDDVIVHGRVSVFPRDGTLQLYVDLVEGAGAGLDQLRLELLRRQLEADGLFDPARKRHLPAFPRRIGVVTSPDGSVWHDIQHVVGRRYPLTELVLAPSPVQGDAAPDGLVAALATIQRHPSVDVVIIGRGGGSAEDLAAFNGEALARAVFRCRVPTISAVGHETDWSICDLVADVRAPTPSAAAEIATPSVLTIGQGLSASLRRLQDATHWALGATGRRFAGLSQRLDHRSPTVIISQQRLGLMSRQALLSRGGRAAIERDQRRLEGVSGVLEALSPTRTLDRGYSIVTDPLSGKVVSGPEEAPAGRSLIIAAATGHYEVTVPNRSVGAASSSTSRRKRAGDETSRQQRAFPLLTETSVSPSSSDFPTGDGHDD
jgi:exodeoxyribonuclease VII large subunit